MRAKRSDLSACNQPPCDDQDLIVAPAADLHVGHCGAGVILVDAGFDTADLTMAIGVAIGVAVAWRFGSGDARGRPQTGPAGSVKVAAFLTLEGARGAA